MSGDDTDTDTERSFIAICNNDVSRKKKSLKKKKKRKKWFYGPNFDLGLFRIFLEL